MPAKKTLKKRKNKVKEFIKDPKKAFFRLSLPILIGMFVQALYNIVDTAFVGRLGAEAIAALTFAFPLFFLFIALNSGLGAGMGSMISRHLGAKKKASAENTAIHGLVLSILMAIIIFVLGMLFLRPIFSVFGAKNSVMVLSIQYMSIILFGAFLMFPSYILNTIFASQGDTKTPMKVQIMALVLNMILDPIFIYVLGYGVRGAAIATIISFGFGLLLFIYYLEKKSYLRLNIRFFRLDLRIFTEIISVGAPATVMTLLISVYIIFVNRFMSSFGTDHVASFGIVSRLESLAIMPIVAFSLSLMTLVGMFFGAKRFGLLRKTIWYGIKTTVMITSSIGLIFFIVPQMFLRIFTPDLNLISIASFYMRIDVFSFPFIAVSMITSRVLQGMGYGFPGLVINIVRVLVFAVPLAFVFVFIFHLSYLWIAAAMVCGGIAASLVAIIWLEIKLSRCEEKDF